LFLFALLRVLPNNDSRRAIDESELFLL